MCTAIALSLTELPVELVHRYGLSARVHDREGRQEFQFHWWQTPAILPVRFHGRFEVLPWGSKARRGPLPYGGWVLQAHVEEGLFSNAGAEEVVIPAHMGLQNGTWLVIDQGIKGVVIQTRGGLIVYMLAEPSSNFYRNMTGQSPTMPVLVNQVI